MYSIWKWVANAMRGKTVTRATLLPPTKPMLEEPLDRYCPGRYHPVKLGDVYNNRYEVVRKLGWGLYSTVWLAKEDRANRHVALKILVADAFASTMTTSNGNLKHRHSKTTSCGKSTACKQTILDANMYPNFSTSSSIQDPTAHTSASSSLSWAAIWIPSALSGSRPESPPPSCGK